MNHWLLKSEPNEFSIDDLARVRREAWSGVRNYQARNYLRDGMRIGDGVLFYHSNCAEPGITGIARVASKAYADPTQFNPESDYFDPGSSPEAPRWLLVDVEFERRLSRVVSLEELKSAAALFGDFALLKRGNRLSVLPVSLAQWRRILKMEKTR